MRTISEGEPESGSLPSTWQIGEFRLIVTRPLSEEERNWLGTFRATQEHRAKRLLGIFVLGLVLLTGHTVALAVSRRIYTDIFAVTSFISCVVFMVATALFAVRYPRLRKWARTARRDLVAGSVDVFARNSEEEGRVEFAKTDSGHLLRLGQPELYFIHADAVRVASSPSVASGFPMRLERMTDGMPNIFSRPMSQEEREELSTLLRIHRSGSRGVALMALELFFILQALRPLWSQTTSDYAIAAVFALLLAVIVRIHAARYLTGRRISRDLAEGMLHRVDSPQGPIEMLPSSRLIWSAGGQPAVWRTVAGIQVSDPI